MMKTATTVNNGDYTSDNVVRCDPDKKKEMCFYFNEDTYIFLKQDLTDGTKSSIYTCMYHTVSQSNQPLYDFGRLNVIGFSNFLTIRSVFCCTYIYRTYAYIIQI